MTGLFLLKFEMQDLEMMTNSLSSPPFRSYALVLDRHKHLRPAPRPRTALQLPILQTSLLSSPSLVVLR